MRDVIAHLNYVHVFVVTIAGFVLGCLWSHGPLFGKQWMAEMKFTKESMEAAMKELGMAKFFLRGFGLKGANRVWLCSLWSIPSQA